MKSKAHSPNEVPAPDRALNLILGLVLTIYGVIGLWQHKLDLTTRRLQIGVLEGGSAWLMAAAFLVGAAVLFSVVVDHYDKRDNERIYQRFRWVATRLGWCLAAAALLAHLYIGFTR